MLTILVFFFFLLRSSMLVQCYAMITLVQVIFFIVYTFSAAAVTHLEDFCDFGTYGRPEYSSCVALLYGNRQRQGRTKGISDIDNVDHGFLLPYFGGPGSFTIDEWRHRIFVPRVWENGTSIVSPSIIHLRPAEPSPADKSYIRQMQDRAHSRDEPCRRLHHRHRDLGPDCDPGQSAAGSVSVGQAAKVRSYVHGRRGLRGAEPQAEHCGFRKGFRVRPRYCWVPSGWSGGRE